MPRLGTAEEARMAHSAPRPSRPRTTDGKPGAKLTKAELLKRLEDAGKKPTGAHKLLRGELLALCKRFKLASDAGLADLDVGALSLILRKKAQTVGGNPSILFVLEETCRVFRDILRAPAEADIWDEAWASYVASGEAIGEGIEHARGSPRRRLLLVRFRQCSACGAKKELKPPQWPFCAWWCWNCMRKLCISRWTLDKKYGVAPERLEGLPHVTKGVVTRWHHEEVTAHFYYKPDLAPVLQDIYGVPTLEQVDGILEERQANLVYGDMYGGAFLGAPHFAAGGGGGVGEEHMHPYAEDDDMSDADEDDEGLHANEGFHGPGPPLVTFWLPAAAAPAPAPAPAPQQRPSDARAAAAAAALRRAEAATAAPPAGGAGPFGTGAGPSGSGAGSSGTQPRGRGAAADAERQQIQAAMAASLAPAHQGGGLPSLGRGRAPSGQQWKTEDGAPGAGDDVIDLT